MNPAGSPSDRGFTLLETLVALLVLSFVVVGLAQGVRFGLAGWDRQAAVIDRDGALDSTMRTLRFLLAGMAPGSDPQAPTIIGTATRIAFTAELPAGAPAVPTRLADVMLEADGAGNLVLRWSPHLHARMLAKPVRQTAVLLPGVAELRLAYFRPAAGGMAGGWVAEWAAIDPPALVRLHIGFVSAVQHWPDLIVAPMRGADID